MDDEDNKNIPKTIEVVSRDVHQHVNGIYKISLKDLCNGHFIWEMVGGECILSKNAKGCWRLSDNLRVWHDLEGSGYVCSLPGSEAYPSDYSGGWYIATQDPLKPNVELMSMVSVDVTPQRGATQSHSRSKRAARGTCDCLSWVVKFSCSWKCTVLVARRSVEDIRSPKRLRARVAPSEGTPHDDSDDSSSYDDSVRTASPMMAPHTPERRGSSVRRDFSSPSSPPKGSAAVCTRTSRCFHYESTDCDTPRCFHYAALPPVQALPHLHVPIDVGSTIYPTFARSPAPSSVQHQILRRSLTASATSAVNSEAEQVAECVASLAGNGNATRMQ